MEYELNIKKHLIALKPLLLFTILMVIIMYLVFSKSRIAEGFVIKGAVVYFAFDYFYMFYLHLNYYHANKNTLFVVDDNNRLFRYCRNDSDLLELKFDDVKYIVIYMMPNMYKGSGFRFFPFEDYHYAIIYSEKGRIVVTSLLVGNCEKGFSNLNIRVIKEPRLFVTV